MRIPVGYRAPPTFWCGSAILGVEETTGFLVAVLECKEAHESVIYSVFCVHYG